MSSFDSIPPAVASIITTIISSRSPRVDNQGELDQLQTRVVQLTDELTRTFAKALREAANKP
jgi:hypothetical protein